MNESLPWSDPRSNPLDDMRRYGSCTVPSQAADPIEFGMRYSSTFRYTYERWMTGRGWPRRFRLFTGWRR